MPTKTPRKIILVDDDENLLSSLREFLEFAAGVKCFGLRGLNELKEQWPQISATSPILAILDINLGVNQPSGVDVYHWLSDQDFKGQIIFLTGHAKDHPLVQQAIQIQGVRVFEKPMEIEELISLVEKAAR